MERRSVSEICAQFQPLLQQYEKDTKLKISHAKEELGTKAGENFMSIVYRTKVYGLRGNKQKYKNSFIRKVVVKNPEIRHNSRSDALFGIEAHMYKHLVPLWGNIGPKCIFSQQGEIILEDLRQRQFNTCERRDFFDLNHCLAVVQTLSSMHSSSLSLKLKDMDKFKELIEPLKENIFPNDEAPAMCIHYKEGVSMALKNLQSIHPRTSKIERAIKFLEQYENKVVATMKEFLSPRNDDDDKYWVITHGDTWKNNIMFSKDEDNKIVNVKFVDFQVARHASPALDFTYFLYTSPKAEVIEDHIYKIIAEYERFFLHELRRNDAPEKDITSFIKPGWFVKELEKYGLFGLFAALTTINAVYMDDNSLSVLESNKTASEVNIPRKTDCSAEKKERILFMVDHYIRHFRKDLL